MFVFLNGQLVPGEQAVVPVSDRGFLLGDGLFETMRVVGGKPFRFAQHIDRMTRGAEFLKIPMPLATKALKKFAEELIEKNQTPEAILRVTLTRGTGERGYLPKNTGAPTLAMTLHPMPAPDIENPPHWSLITSSFRIPAGDPLASFKTTSKLPHIMARMEAEEKNADEALLVNSSGEVVETAGGNIFWIFREKVCTVPTARGMLPGITRAVVLELCQTLGLPTNKWVIKPEALLNSEGAFVTQSVHGIVPVVALDGQSLALSPMVEKIRRAYCELLAKPQAVDQFSTLAA